MRRVTVGPSRIHGRGIFAGEAIGRGRRVGAYLGVRARRNGPYVLWVREGEGALVGISGQNDLRFVNHAARPNARFVDADLFALRRIRLGEEITVDYGPDPPGAATVRSRRPRRT